MCEYVRVSVCALNFTAETGVEKLRFRNFISTGKGSSDDKTEPKRRKKERDRVRKNLLCQTRGQKPKIKQRRSEKASVCFGI